MVEAVRYSAGDRVKVDGGRKGTVVLVVPPLNEPRRVIELKFVKRTQLLDIRRPDDRRRELLRIVESYVVEVERKHGGKLRKFLTWPKVNSLRPVDVKAEGGTA